MIKINPSTIYLRYMSYLQAEPSKRSIWSGRISIGLVNVPVKLYTMIKDHSPSFNYVRKGDACPLKYQRVCKYNNEIVPWEEVSRGIEVRKDEYIVFDKEELDKLKPESSQKIKVDKFVPLEQVDRIFFDKCYILAPDEAPDSYGLLLKAFQRKEMAGVGKFTMRTKEYPVVIYPYRDALILTTLKYADEVVDPQAMEEVQNLMEPSQEELELALKIIENLSGDFDVTEYEDTYRKRIEELVKKKLLGETIKVEEPETEIVRELMSALQETLQQFQKEQ